MTQPLSPNLNGDDFAVVDEVMRGREREMRPLALRSAAGLSLPVRATADE
jgi:hypothetical protein